MKNGSVKKSLEKSKNNLEEKRKMVKQKICIKKATTFTIIAINFVQDQLIKQCLTISTQQQNELNFNKIKLMQRVKMEMSQMFTKIKTR